MSDERQGIDVLRDAVETVAAEIERRPAAPRRASGARRVARLAAAAAVLTAIAAGWWMLRPQRCPEVEVVGWKIRGQSVPAKVVEGVAPGTILVMPDRERRAAVTATAVPMGTGR